MRFIQNRSAKFYKMGMFNKDIMYKSATPMKPDCYSPARLKNITNYS